MKSALCLTSVAGLSLMISLMGYYGLDPLARALVIVGWGLLAICAFHLAPLLLSAIAWRALVRVVSQCPFATLVWVRWIREGDR